MTAAGPWACVVRVDLVTGCLTATGQLGAGTTHLLYDGISALLRADQPTWTVDVTDLVVADHAGLRAIGSCYRRAVRHGRRIALHGASPALRHALYRLRLEQHLMSSSRVVAEESGGVAGVRLPLVPEPVPPSSPTGEATGIDSLHRGFPAPGTT